MRQRNKIIAIRTSEIEYKIIKMLADKSKQSVTDYIIKCATGKEIKVIDVKPIITEIKRIGNNINQLTRLANMGRINTVYLRETQTELKNIYSELQKICRRCI